jgi:hypothetical protein
MPKTVINAAEPSVLVLCADAAEKETNHWEE